MAKTKKRKPKPREFWLYVCPECVMACRSKEQAEDFVSQWNGGKAVKVREVKR